jgi:hypothetical protein
MKKLLTIILSLISLVTLAQTPQQINYQAIARNSSGQLLQGQSIVINVKFYNNNLATTSSYEEKHTPVTDNYGYFNLLLGTGTPISGSFSGITWNSGSVQYELYLNGTLLGSKTTFASVPYALYSNGGLPIGTNGQTLYYDGTFNTWKATSNLFSNNTIVSIGTTTAFGAKLNVLQTSDTSGLHIQNTSAVGRHAGIRSFVNGNSIYSSANPASTAIMGSHNRVINTGTGEAVGSFNEGHGFGNSVGVFGLGGSLSNTATVIGVFGTTSGLTSNRWAGWFDQGAVFIRDSLFLGNSVNPGNPGDVLRRTTTGRAVWSPGANPINFSASFTGTYTIPSGTLTPITFNNMDYNNSGGSFNGNTFTAPVEGIYHVDGSITLNNTSITGYNFQLQIIKSGSSNRTFSQYVSPSISQPQNSVNADVHLFVGETIQLGVWQNSSVGISLISTGAGYNYFNCHKVN